MSDLWMFVIICLAGGLFTVPFVLLAEWSARQEIKRLDRLARLDGLARSDREGRVGEL